MPQLTLPRSFGDPITGNRCPFCCFPTKHSRWEVNQKNSLSRGLFCLNLLFFYYYRIEVKPFHPIFPIFHLFIILGLYIVLVFYFWIYYRDSFGWMLLLYLFHFVFNFNTFCNLPWVLKIMKLLKFSMRTTWR